MRLDLLVGTCEKIILLSISDIYCLLIIEDEKE